MAFTEIEPWELPPGGWDFGDEFVGGYGGGAAGRRLRRKKKPKRLELLASALEAPVAWAYGEHLVGGNVILQHKDKDEPKKPIKIFQALGDGEWDSVKVAWVNDKRINVANTTKFHFHPGLDGEILNETDPATRNQKICSFFPTGYRPRLTFSRTAYVSLKLPRDQKRPKRTREFEIFGIYRTRRVRIFDNAGNQTSYAYSTNPAWCALDLLIARYLKSHGLLNEALTTAEKTRVDFQAFKDWADFCDGTLTINGESVKRFECHVAFDDDIDLLRALELILVTGRAYLLERNGKLAPFPDKARNSILVLDADDLAPGSLQLARRPVRNTPNLYRFTYNDLDSGRGIGTISTTGIAVAGTDTEFTKWLEKDGVIDLRSGAQKGEFRRVKIVTDDTNAILASAFSADQAAGTAYGNPAKDFEDRTRESVDEDHQDAMGRILEYEADLGGQTPERAERLAEYLRRSVTDRPRRVRFTILSGAAGALDLLPGDVLTAPAHLEFLTSREYEVMGITDNPDGSRSVEAIEYQASVFVETAGPQPQPADQPDLSDGFAENAPQVGNVLKNASFFKIGVGGQEGANNAKFFKKYSNAGGSPTDTDITWNSTRDIYLLKTSTSNVDKIGIRTLWNNLGLMFKPAQPVTVAVALRHAGANDLYNKDVKIKIDSDAEDYTDAAGAKLELIIPADTIGNTFDFFYATFELRADLAVPDRLNLFIWSEATGAAKSNFDLEIDWVTLTGGRTYVHFDNQGVGYTTTWVAGPGLYDIEGAFVKEAAPSSDTGGAGEAAGGLGTLEVGANKPGGVPV